MNHPHVVELQPHILKGLESDDDIEILSRVEDFDPKQFEEIAEISLSLPDAPAQVSALIREGWQCLAFIRYNEEAGMRITTCVGKKKA